MKVYYLSFNLMKNSTADYFIALSNKLSEVGKVIIISSKIKETNIQLHPTIEVLKWPSKRPSRLEDFFFLCRAIRRHRPDTMISVFGTVNLFLICGWLYRVKNRIAWIRSLSTQFQQKRFLVWRRSMVYRLATTIITNSNATKADAMDFFRINSTKIKVLPNSVKDYSQQLQAIDIDINKLVYVGRLHPTKGIDVLIRAMAVLIPNRSDLQLHILGSGESEAPLKALCKELHLEKQIHFLGEQPKEVVLKAYKSSYCTIIPSHAEAFGFTVIEAMSTGTCVVGANNTGIKEIILPNETGLLFETNNHIDLAQKIKTLSQDNALRNRLAASGYQRFKTVYDNEVAIQRDFKFFKNLNHDD